MCILDATRYATCVYVCVLVVGPTGLNKTTNGVIDWMQANCGEILDQDMHNGRFMMQLYYF